ncbi:MAG: pyrroline-5-carboxylate reductase [Spirochaetaceae bacterium]|nr:pyrroline-5-carboxylate reductase [Spirochaetaceae bacterium]
MKALDEIAAGFIGAGAMGSALVKAALNVIDGGRIFVTCRSAENRSRVAASLGVTEARDNSSLVLRSDIVFIAVKPSQFSGVLREIAPHCGGKILVSAAAGITLASIRAALSGSAPVALIRVMPNIAASVGESMTAFACENALPETEGALALARGILAHAGLAERVDEGLMDCVTAISGSGPAYAFVFMEALADAAVGLGMSRAAAYTFAAQTLKGAAALALESGLHPAALKDAVCSPAGTTIEAIRVLEAGGFRSAIIEAARSAALKSRSSAPPAL